jgi:hypothetical protein
MSVATRDLSPFSKETCPCQSMKVDGDLEGWQKIQSLADQSPIIPVSTSPVPPEAIPGSQWG